MNTRGLRKERNGVVISDRMQKTVVVSLERTVMHPKYQKFLAAELKSKPMMKAINVTWVTAC